MFDVEKSKLINKMVLELGPLNCDMLNYLWNSKWHTDLNLKSENYETVRRKQI